ncbi:MAG: nucleoside deaminase [Bacteroidales bacterium]|nr:nucleoside deaminase [Candidatus Colimorpha pelethequi]MCQ2262302.1 nucleoside deaminase [Bacteroidales bacterium]
MNDSKHKTNMAFAIEEARKGIQNGEGGPFGTVIIKDGVIVGAGHNKVLANNDPTAHGEISAIRNAGKLLGTYDLSGCILYTTGEPCHMCLCACMWANIEKVYYGCSIEDNGRIGFRDDKFDKIFGGRDKLTDFLVQTCREDCLKLFDEYTQLQHTVY